MINDGIRIYISYIWFRDTDRFKYAVESHFEKCAEKCKSLSRAKNILKYFDVLRYCDVRKSFFLT